MLLVRDMGNEKLSRAESAFSALRDVLHSSGEPCDRAASPRSVPGPPTACAARQGLPRTKSPSPSESGSVPSATWSWYAPPSIIRADVRPVEVLTRHLGVMEQLPSVEEQAGADLEPFRQLADMIDRQRRLVHWANEAVLYQCRNGCSASG